MPSTTLSEVHDVIRSLADPARAAGAARFFKNGPRDYGEGDRFLGIRVPDLRRVARAHRTLSRHDTLELLHSPWHEERLAALFILVDTRERATGAERVEIHRAYLGNTAFVNNWDLVDSSAAELVGSHVPTLGIRVLQRLARSKSLWERRIAMVATHWCIKHDDFTPTMLIAEQLLGHGHDLINKAVRWMLREAGKRDPAILRGFLDAHATSMPRVALRYAIERFGEQERRHYLALRRTDSRP